MVLVDKRVLTGGLVMIIAGIIVTIASTDQPIGQSGMSEEEVIDLLFERISLDPSFFDINVEIIIKEKQVHKVDVMGYMNKKIYVLNAFPEKNGNKTFNKTIEEIIKEEEKLIYDRMIKLKLCLIGLLSFARVLKFLFNKFKNVTVALLTGFMIGSLNKVWPWKKTLSMRENSHGEMVPFIQENVLPSDFIGDAQLLLATVSLVIGFLLIVGLEKFAPKEK